MVEGSVADAIAAEVLIKMRDVAPDDVKQQINDNLRWIQQLVKITLSSGVKPASFTRMTSVEEKSHWQ